MEERKTCTTFVEILGFVKDFLKNQQGIVRVDEAFYQLLIPMACPGFDASQICANLGRLYEVWKDPACKHIVYLPRCDMVDSLKCDEFSDVVRSFYSLKDPERVAFFDYFSNFGDIGQDEIKAFCSLYNQKQREQLFAKGCAIVGYDENLDYSGPQLIVVGHQKTLPVYKGKSAVVQYVPQAIPCILPTAPVAPPELFDLPEQLPIYSIKLLFNECDKFFEQYVLKVKQPMHPIKTLTRTDIKNFLFYDHSLDVRTEFEKYQLQELKSAWGRLKIPENSLSDAHVCYDAGFTKLTGSVDIIWNEGLYRITRHTPPSRNALLQGVEPELPLLAAACNKPFTHLAYIHVKGYGADPITITRYNDPQELIDQNIQKLAYYDSRSKKEST